MFRYLSEEKLPEVELFVYVRHDLVVDLRLDDSLHLDVYEVIERVDVLLEETSDLQEGRHQLHLLLSSADCYLHGGYRGVKFLFVVEIAQVSSVSHLFASKLLINLGYD